MWTPCNIESTIENQKNIQFPVLNYLIVNKEGMLLFYSVC